MSDADADADDFTPPPPIPVYRDRLLGVDYTSRDDSDIDEYTTVARMLDTALKLSAAEYDFAEMCSIEKIHNKQAADRRASVANLRQRLQRVASHDTTVKAMADIVEPLLDLWIRGIQDEFEIDDERHAQLFAMLGTLRITADEIAVLKTVIIRGTS